MKLLTASTGLAVAGYLFGDETQLLFALVSFMLLELMARILCWATDRTPPQLTRSVAQKLVILSMVIVANLVDQGISPNRPLLVVIVLWAFLGYEGTRILGHATALGLPVPKRLSEALSDLSQKGNP